MGHSWRQAWIKFAAVVAVMLTAATVDGREPALHKVGGKEGWTSSNVNYTDWALHDGTFYVGDWLLFVFNKQQYNVLEVNNTSYEDCNERDFVKNITKGGRDVFQLTKPKTYYFISAGGYCYGGMKVSVDVVEFNSSTGLAPAQPTNGCFRSNKHISAFLAIATLLWMHIGMD